MRTQALFTAGVVWLVWIGNAAPAGALPQYQRMVNGVYGYRAPCITCHTDGAGSSLSPYGKAFERAGRTQAAVQLIAGKKNTGDMLTFGEKLAAKANPNDPKSTPAAPGDWLAQDIPTKDLKLFAPAEVTSFTLLEGKFLPEKEKAYRAAVGAAFQDEDLLPTYFFGEVSGKRQYVIQYVRSTKLKKTIGLVVNIKGQVVSAAWVGKKTEPLPKEIFEPYRSKDLPTIRSLKVSGEEEEEVRLVMIRGLTGINLVFGG